MSKNLVLHKIDRLAKELVTLRLMVESMKETEVTVKVVKYPSGTDEIYQRALDLYNVTKYEINGKSRKHKIVTIRQILCFFLNELRGLNLNDIADLIGYKEHSAVLHSVNQAKRHIETGDAKFATIYNNFKDLIV
jgi:chromosomal replication initiator protein